MPASIKDRVDAHGWVTRSWNSLCPTRKDKKIARPLNCFMLFRTWWVANQMHLPENNPPPPVNGRTLTTSQRAANAWNELKPSERVVWQLRAEAWRDRHAIVYPEYKFSPRRTNGKHLTRSPTPASGHGMRRRSLSVPPLPVGQQYFQTMDAGASSMPSSPQQVPGMYPIPEGWNPYATQHTDASPMAQFPAPVISNAMGFSFGGAGEPVMDFSTFALDSNLTSPAGSSAHPDEFMYAHGADIWENSPFQFPPVDGGAGFTVPGPDSVYMAPYAPFPGAPLVPEGNFIPPSSHQPALPVPVTPYPFVPSNAPVENDAEYAYEQH